MIESGLTEEQALAALTTVPAQLLGLSATHGKVAAGRPANLVVVDGSYFDEKSAVRYVFVDGELFEYKAKPKKKKTSDSEQPAAKVAGTWSYVVDVPGQSTRGSLIISGTPGDYSGVLKTEDSDEERAVDDISVDGNEVFFTTKFDAGGQMVTLEFDLSVEGDLLEGSVSVGAFGTFDVEGERVTDPN